MKKNKKVLLYSPYLHILGGGERHILSIMKVFDDEGYDIDILSDNPDILRNIKATLRMSFNNAQVIPNFFLHERMISKIRRTKEYEYLFYVTDGSYFISKARHNFIFAMYPDKKIFNLNWLNKMKVYNFNIICNGPFTGEFVDKWFGRKPKVIPPYIDDVFLNNDGAKEKVILNVGRFFENLHTKRQDVLIDAFKKLQNDGKFADYQLILAGGCQEEDVAYVKKLQEKAKNNTNISFVLNPDFMTLLSLYKKGKIYWHAAGVDVDEEKHPERVEHFGITPLEAMASGCVVMSHNSGGPKRYISKAENGYLYDSIDDLVDLTKKVLEEDVHDVVYNGKAFVKTYYSLETFQKNVRKLFNNI